MFILDEAHNAAPASATKYAIDSKLTRAIRDLTPRFEHKLFLSATPHNGHSNSFSAILEMLDPQKFCRGVPVHHASRDAVMIRRLKHDLREIGEEFPERKIIRIDIRDLPEDAPELVLSHLLQRYRRDRETRLEDATKGQRASAMLVVISLQKRLLSSIEAFACSPSFYLLPPESCSLCTWRADVVAFANTTSRLGRPARPRPRRPAARHCPRGEGGGAGVRVLTPPISFIFFQNAWR